MNPSVRPREVEQYLLAKDYGKAMETLETYRLGAGAKWAGWEVEPVEPHAALGLVAQDDPRFRPGPFPWVSLGVSC